MNTMRLSESERQALLAYLKKTYKYDDGHIVNRKTGKRRRERKIPNGYLGITIRFKGNLCNINCHRLVWVLCNGCWPRHTVDHINGNRHDNRIENLREVSQSDNIFNTLLPWRPNRVTGVAGVVENKKRDFMMSVRGVVHHFHNPYEAFYWAIACGKRYKPTPSPSQKGGEH